MASKDKPARDIFDAGGRGLQHQGLRRANERVVLLTVGFNPGVSNADIARISGLAPQTVSAILTEIERDGLITRGQVLRGRRGQPATPIYLRADGAFAIGVEIGWRHVDVVLLDLQAQVLDRRQRQYGFPSAAHLLPEIAEMVLELIETLPLEARPRLIEMGLAMPSTLAMDTGYNESPIEERRHWGQTDIGGELQRRTGLEVSIFNDGNAACWAELIALPAPRPKSFVYFLISRYIGAGIVGEGTLWEGPTGNSANLGAMLVGEAGAVLQPAHMIASINALSTQLAAAGMAVDHMAPDSWDWTAFGTVLDQWIEDSAKALAKVVFNTTTVIETDLVVIDGIMPKPVTERLVARVISELKLLPNAPFSPPQVLQGHVGALSPAIGAAELTLYRRYLSRNLVDLIG